MPPSPTHLTTQRVRVWDLPTRLFHWALLLCVLGLVITGKLGGNWMLWHFRLGYCVFALLLFRLIWGFVGGYWSRFGRFIYSPVSIWAYLKGRGKPEHAVGHNPLGAASVFALLVFLSVQVATGLVSDDEIANQGPLAKFVSNARVSLATWWHKDIGQWILIGLVVLHVLAIMFYLHKKKDNLIKPMIHGDKSLDFAATSARDDTVSRSVAVVVLLACACVVYAVVSL